jgi:NADH-quinone oxidoreductase subunit G
MAQINPAFRLIGGVTPAPWGAFGEDGPMDDAPFVTPIDNFYMTDPISRASETMALCTRTFGDARKTGTHG